MWSGSQSSIRPDADSNVLTEWEQCDIACSWLDGITAFRGLLGEAGSSLHEWWDNSEAWCQRVKKQCKRMSGAHLAIARICMRNTCPWTRSNAQVALSKLWRIGKTLKDISLSFENKARLKSASLIRHRCHRRSRRRTGPVLFDPSWASSKAAPPPVLELCGITSNDCGKLPNYHRVLSKFHYRLPQDSAVLRFSNVAFLKIILARWSIRAIFPISSTSLHRTLPLHLFLLHNLRSSDFFSKTRLDPLNLHSAALSERNAQIRHRLWGDD